MQSSPSHLLVACRLLTVLASALALTAPAFAQAGGDGAQCPGDGEAPAPVEVQVTSVPIVVASTTDHYFVLYARHEVDQREVEQPVLVKLGEAGTTTLAENVAPLAPDRYRVEKYLVDNPADVDGDCTDDITELGNLGAMNPVNAAAPIDLRDGAVVLQDKGAFDALQTFGTLKFILVDWDTDRPSVYFINSATHPLHATFLSKIGLEREAYPTKYTKGVLVFDPDLLAEGGGPGVYHFDTTDFGATFEEIELRHSMLAASIPFIDGNLAFYIRTNELLYHQDDLESFRASSRVGLVLEEDLVSAADFLPLHSGEGYGRLQNLNPGDRPHPRDVVIYEALPNELPRVAGVISTVPQTPLSHVNLRAVQDGIPNAFVRNALDDGDIAALLGGFVRFKVAKDGWELRAATPEEADSHYESSRPTHTRTPERDLSVRGITPLSQIGFNDWKAFGVKAANVAVLRTLGFPEGTVPDGFAIPFYFYDEFMKTHGFYDDVKEMLADEDFQRDFAVQDDMLDDLRDDIKDAETPQWMIDALTAMHAIFPEGQSLRYRSSTNNEDLPGFNGAGLYDSKTQHADETEDDGIDKSFKQVLASLWTFRAFTEREFHRIDHLAAAMGILVHPNYSDELANGVAVSFDPINSRYNRYYVNTQIGEDLVTNPQAHSVPEELLLDKQGPHVLATSNQVSRGRLIMSEAQLQQLRRHLSVIHDHFEKLYNPSPGDPFAMEIEFKITSENILAIKQARPWVFGDNSTSPPPRSPPPSTGGGGFAGGGGGGGGGSGLLFPPQSPMALAATPGDGMVRLEWSPPDNDGGSAIRRYEYRFKEGRSEFREWTPIPDSALEEINASGYTVGDLLNGTVYVFELRAVNAAGSGRVAETVEVVMPLDPARWSNFRAEDLEGVELGLDAFLLEGASRDRELRFGEGLRFEQDELDREGEVTATHMGSYGYRYTSRTTGELNLEFDEGESCRLRLTFSGEGAGSYSYRCGGSSRGQGSFGMSELENRVPEITSPGPFELEENRTRAGQLEAVDWDKEDEIVGYAITGGADGGLFRVEAQTGELSFREAPDYENPGDMASEQPRSEAEDNEYIVVVEVTSGEGERERSREQAIRVWVGDVEMEEAFEDEMEETESLFVPVTLSSAGRNNSFFTSELTLTNRGESEAALNYSYTSGDEPAERSGKASDLLPAGRQRIATDTLDYLRDLGVPIPETGNQVGTLRVEAPPGSEVRAVVRTTTVVPDGRAGLAYPGVREEEGFSEPVYLCGLRQNSRDRSNVAFQNMGAPGEGAITLRTTVYSGEASETSPRELDDITLGPGGFHQFSGLLGRVENGYVKVERVEGEAPFYAYGVINDQANSDGSFVFPVAAASLEGKTGQTLPVIVETQGLHQRADGDELLRRSQDVGLRVRIGAYPGDDKTVVFSMTLQGGEQVIVPELVEALRQEETAKLGRSRRFYLGPLFVTAEEGDLSGIVVGARTSSEGGGGRYGVFYNAVPEGEGFDREAWVKGLQQNAENRSNLALVNTGEVDDSPSVFHLEIYNGETGMLEETVVTKEVPARGWHQIDGILLRAGPETRQGYVRIEKMSGENPFLAYGVVNDGGAPGQRSGDGAYLPARE